MDPRLLGYLALSAASPPLIALVLWVARRHMWQTIALLSLLALALGLADVVMLTIEYRSLGLDPSFFYGNFGSSFNGASPDNALTLYASYEAWRLIVISAAGSLAAAGWIIAIYQTIQSRRWRWLAAILICASLAGLVAILAQNPWIITSAPAFDAVLPTHPFAKVLLLVSLPYLASAVTALYGLVVLRRAAAAEPAPSAPARLSLAEALNAPRADVPFEDVVFEVEELPHAQR